MKKVLLTLIMAIIGVNLLNAQITFRDSVIANFETGLEGATTWGPTPPTVVLNPLANTVNNSDSVLYFTASNWEGVVIHFDSSEYRNYFTRIQFDIYLTTIGTITVQLDAGYGTPISLYYNVPVANEWQRVYFDLPNPVDMGYKQVWFRTGQTSNFYLDNVTFQTPNFGQWKEFSISNVVFGSYDDSADFTGQLQLRWDTDSLYSRFVVHDDTVISAGGANYQRDNIEFYVDVDNSKGIHWPRGGGWVQAVDLAYDTNDYQLRLVPGAPFAENNSVRPAGPSIDTGYNYTYERTPFGYIINLNIAWDALDSSYTPVFGSNIGFDVLISDNDSSVVNDAGRNQITFNSPSMFLYNDPSLWATLRLDAGGLFSIKPDTVDPSTPANVTATQTNTQVRLAWDPSTDSTAVMSYIVYNGQDSVTTVAGLQTGNGYTFTTLTPGTYTLGVLAVDNYGNMSDTSFVNITVTEVPDTGTAVDNTSIALFKFGPNPMNDYLDISSQYQIKSVTIISMNGQAIENRVVNSSNYRLNVSHLESGLYLLRVQTTKGIQTQRIIKR